MNATDCSKSAAAGSFLQCDDYDSGESFIGLGHRVARRSVEQLKSEHLRESIRKIMLEAGSAQGRLSPMKSVDVTPDDMASLVKLPALSFLEESAEEGATPPKLTPGEEAKAGAKCVVANNPNCQALSDKFVFMQADVMDKKQTLEDAIAVHELDCKTSQQNWEAQLSSLESRLKDAQAALAEATEQMNNADEQVRLLTIEHKKFDKEFRNGMQECRTNIDGFGNEKCSLEKIRDEVLKSKEPPQDCEISSWIAEDCDKNCGGGKQKLTRTIASHPLNGGSKCPVLEMVRSCNEQECPIDCALGEWSGWSTCSAPCGGGVKERSRPIQQQPLHGGDGCGVTSDAQPCNPEACSQPCLLGAWSSWGGCSVVCGGGTKRRNRPVAVAAIGSGECPSLTDDERQEYEECNNMDCLPPPQNQTHQCKAKLDVMLLLDGSGSLRKNGWKAVKKFGSIFSKAMVSGEDDIKQGTILFSGPRTYRTLSRCVNGPRCRKGRKCDEVDMEKECNVKWVQRLRGEQGKAAEKIESLTWPRATTLTSGALSMATSGLNYGRVGAQSIVIVVTDGVPMSQHATRRAAKKLRRKARLIFVAVGRGLRGRGLRRMRSWASRPTRDNLFKIGDFNTLQNPKTVDKIIVEMCPSLV